MTSDDDVLAAIHADLEQDRVYVDPALARQFTPAQLEELEQQAAEHEAFVVAYPLEDQDEFGGSPDDLVTRLHDQYPADGLYLANNSLKYDGSTPWLQAFGHGTRAYTDEYHVDNTVLRVVAYEEPEDLGTAYVRAFEVLEMPRKDAEALRESTYEVYRDENYWWLEDEKLGPDFLPTWGLPAILVAALAAAVGVWLARRRAAATPRPKPSVLPPSAVERIREAHDQRLEKRARDEVLGLGEAIDAADITPTADTAAWQAALDHYDAARRVLDRRDPEVLDVIGALVLAGRGRTALRSALAGRRWTPARPCFLNPLHGDARRERDVAYAGHTVSAPLCRDCDAALAGDRAPDILDVARQGRPVHYFETDGEPWASTGYGALHEDLVERLHRSGR